MSKLVFIDENGKRHYNGYLAIEQDKIYLPCDRVASLEEIKTVGFQDTVMRKSFQLMPSPYYNNSKEIIILNDTPWNRQFWK